MRGQGAAVVLIPMLAGACLLAACSWDNVQRTGYETVETMRQRQCMEQPDRPCPDNRTSYDQYQSERARLQAR